MSVLSITNGLFANSEKIIKLLARQFNCKIITDEHIINKTHQKYNIKLASLQKVVESKQISFNDFTHEKEKCIAALKRTLAGFIQEENCIFHGLMGHLIPKEVTHIMRILIIAEKKQRIQNAISKNNLSEKEATKKIYNSDKLAFLWTSFLFQKKAWDNSLYDIIIPSKTLDVEESVNLVSKYLKKLPFNNEELIELETLDFKLASEVESALSEIGQGLLVKSKNSSIDVTIDKKVMMLTKFQQKIVQTAQTIKGVKSVEIKIGKNYYKGNIVRNYEFETPLRVLLVDDEKEFVQTLSDRLKLRQFASEIAYNGQEALDFTDKEDTEVILLDLKMPGIDGIEVLKKIKKSKPHIEVIILTGHGSEQDRKICMETGAFAYLHKPADIEIITETMKQAYKKIEAARNSET
ncbi:MAG: response regulator [Deltaproteobacteria bacterium]|jgi:two-component system response regulator CpxR|nr:response regulator [Deltaproteobacteria bacterium]